MAEVAEQVAVAMTLLDPKRTTIYSNSRAAVRAFQSGLVSKEAAKVLKGRSLQDEPHHITWFPARIGSDVIPGRPNPNEITHKRAQGFICRGDQENSNGLKQLEFGEPLVTFHEITSHYRDIRRVFSSPNHKLNRAQSITLKMLQTDSYPSKSFFSMVHAEIDPTCPDCGEVSSLKQMLWRCPALQDCCQEAWWNAAINGPSYDVQLLAVQKARERAERPGLPVPTWV